MPSFDFIQIVYGLAAAIIGFLTSRAWSRFACWRKTRGQSALFAGLEGPTLFVFAPREPVDTAFLPRMSTEDFLAINNIISGFLSVKADVTVKMRDSDHLTDQDKKQFNLVLICSSKTNTATKEALDALRGVSTRMSDLVPSFETANGKIAVRWNKGTYPSDSFVQNGPEYDDVAIIVKARSPWAGQRKVLIVAGIRGFGTWGAAECLKKWWQPLFNKKGKSRSPRLRKEGDFAAVVSVKYKEYDIKDVKLLHIVDLENEYV